MLFPPFPLHLKVRTRFRPLHRLHFSISIHIRTQISVSYHPCFRIIHFQCPPNTRRECRCHSDILLPSWITEPDPGLSYIVVYKIYSGRRDGNYAMSFMYNEETGKYEKTAGPVAR